MLASQTEFCGAGRREKETELPTGPSKPVISGVRKRSPAAEKETL